jgi:hypothetical protein
MWDEEKGVKDTCYTLCSNVKRMKKDGLRIHPLQ